jgi:hypothetical protein
MQKDVGSFHVSVQCFTPVQMVQSKNDVQEDAPYSMLWYTYSTSCSALYVTQYIFVA